MNISLEINRERDAPPSYEEAVHYNATLGVVNLVSAIPRWLIK